MLRGYFLLKVYLCACAPSLTEEDISQAPLQGCRATHSCAAGSYEPRSPTALAYAIIVAQSLQACLQRALAVCLPGHLPYARPGECGLAVLRVVANIADRACEGFKRDGHEDVDYGELGLPQ